MDIVGGPEWNHPRPKNFHSCAGRSKVDRFHPFFSTFCQSDLQGGQRMPAGWFGSQGRGNANFDDKILGPSIFQAAVNPRGIPGIYADTPPIFLDQPL
jgi:hypothetical protein